MNYHEFLHVINSKNEEEKCDTHGSIQRKYRN